MTRHFLEIDDLTAEELATVLDLARQPRPHPVLAGRGVALVFEKPSNRTRNATEMAVVQLGGHPISIRDDEVGLGTRETTEDIARTLACYHAVIGARVRDHRNLRRMAAALDAARMAVPVINLLSDQAHPCQALADLLTMDEVLGGLRGRTLAWVGDANNVCRSLLLGGALAGMRMKVASPPGYGLGPRDAERVAEIGGDLELVDSPEEAVEGADAVHTDVWVSMGQEAEAAARRRAFEGFTVDQSLMARAAPHAGVLHCLPAHRGEEIAADVVDGPRSVVWRQAENRLHSARGLLLWLLEEAA
ncbi:MAG TPA: ornithine carbamoyltransferase [Acidimicrobiales bacterium]|nr:ornithine carbamoyltransferase [Acidimicrobiales bacterium]